MVSLPTLKDNLSEPFSMPPENLTLTNNWGEPLSMPLENLVTFKFWC